MTKQLLIIAASGVFSGALVCQTHQSVTREFSFQHPGWIAAPGSSAVMTHMNLPDGQTGPVVGRPFSATETRQTLQVLADGTKVQNSATSLVYRDDRGRMRAESKTRYVIYDPVAGFTYEVNPEGRNYLKGQAHANGSTQIAVVGNTTSVSSHSGTAGHSELESVQRRLGGRARANSEDLPPQVVNGIMAKGTRITITIPAGTFGNDRDVKVVNERWYSDDLKVLVRSSNSDPRFGVSTYELTNIVQAAADPGLFQVPGDYTERTDHHR